MNPDLAKRIAQIAADRESGASDILSAAIGVLRDTIAAGDDLAAVAAALREAQPSMAGIWNATAAALSGDLEPFAQRVRRATPAITRFALDLLETGLSPGQPLRLVTISASRVVAHVLESLARRRPTHVACAEGRPALEGRRLAERLAGSGASVSCCADAAIGHALPGADAVLLGADAVAANWFVNKTGTLMLAAAAAHYGVPAYVLAGREKFLEDDLAARLTLRSGRPDEVWESRLEGLQVLNPYFERVPLGLITGLVTDVGVR